MPTEQMVTEHFRTSGSVSEFLHLRVRFVAYRPTVSITVDETVAFRLGVRNVHLYLDETARGNGAPLASVHAWNSS